MFVVFVVWEGFLANFQKVHTSRRQLIHAREESKQMLRIGSSVSGKCSNPAALAIGLHLAFVDYSMMYLAAIYILPFFALSGGAWLKIITDNYKNKEDH